MKMLSARSKTAGFTLIELLTVIAIVGILAALLFPVFASVRGKARQTVCASNMRQIGTAIIMYAQDYDDQFPWGDDPSDAHTSIWSSTSFAAIVPTMPYLHNVLDPFIKSRDLWRCPSDTGYDFLDVGPAGGGWPLNARPTQFIAFGTSYLYRTEIPLRHETLSGIAVRDLSPPHAEHGPSEINLLMDGNGSWHGGSFFVSKRYNVLLADGHLKNETDDQLNAQWNTQFE
jgi:prepilin-type N-terminal cleavage/methylation domain-containing protein